MKNKKTTLPYLDNHLRIIALKPRHQVNYDAVSDQLKGRIDKNYMVKGGRNV